MQMDYEDITPPCVLDSSNDFIFDKIHGIFSAHSQILGSKFYIHNIDETHTGFIMKLNSKKVTFIFDEEIKPMDGKRSCFIFVPLDKNIGYTAVIWN
jgi:hypothetical protein